MVQKARSATDDFHTATPYLCIAGAAAAIDFYKAAFDAEEFCDASGMAGLARGQCQWLQSLSSAQGRLAARDAFHVDDLRSNQTSSDRQAARR